MKKSSHFELRLTRTGLVLSLAFVLLGLLGNSGNTTGAHLHMQVTDHNFGVAVAGGPFVFAAFTYLGPGSDYPEKQVSEPWVNSIAPGDGV